MLFLGFLHNACHRDTFRMCCHDAGRFIMAFKKQTVMELPNPYNRLDELFFSDGRLHGPLSQSATA